MMESKIGGPGKVVLNPSSVDKGKILEAVESLIRNSRQPTVWNENVKFRFRLRFKRMKKSQLASTRNSSGLNLIPPTNVAASPAKPDLSWKTSVPAFRGSSGSQPRRASQWGQRETERQRRLDIKHKFETLKSLVPQTAGMYKASKLVILNQTVDFCRLLSSSEPQLAEEWRLLSARNRHLKRHLTALKHQVMSQRKKLIP